MKSLKIICFLVFGLLHTLVFAQEKSSQKDDGEVEKVYQFVEQFPILKAANCDSLPNYQACKSCSDQKMVSLILRELEYPRSVWIEEISTKIYISFIIKKNGKLEDIQFIKSTYPHEILEQAVLEALEKFAQKYDWIPGQQNGKPVHVKMILPIRFN